MNKNFFISVSGLYAAIGALAQNGIGPDTDESHSYDLYNIFISKNDFSSKVFTGPDGLKGVKWCYGDVMAPALYDDIIYAPACCIPFQECFVIARKQEKSFLVSNLGEELISADALYPIPERPRWIFMQQGGKWGIVSYKGDVVFDACFDEIERGSNGFLFVWQDGKEGFINPWGELIDPQFEEIIVDESDYLVATLNGRDGYIDEYGNFTPDRDEAFYYLGVDI